MNPESRAWDNLRRHASAQIRSGFPDRVLRAARQGVEAAPSIFSQFALSAATAALCYMAVTFFDAHRPTAASEQNLADWQEIASSTGEASLGQ